MNANAQNFIPEDDFPEDAIFELSDDFQVSADDDDFGADTADAVRLIINR